MAVFLAAGGGSSTPKIQRPPAPAEVTNPGPSRVKSTMKNELRTPKVQGNNASTGPKSARHSNLTQSLLTLKKSVIK
jgi:hypothetical protein